MATTKKLPLCLGALSLAFAFAAFLALPASATTVDAECGLSGTIGISPGLTPTAGSEAFTFGAGIVGGSASCPHVPAKVKGTLTSPSAACAPPVTFFGEPAVGVLTIRWPDATASRIRVRMTPAYSGTNPTLVRLSGKVRSGLYAGDSVVAMFNAVPAIAQQDCTNEAVTLWNFATGEGGHQQSLTFSHP